MGFKVTRDFVNEKGSKGTVGVESAPPTHWLHMRTDDDPNDLSRYNYHGGKIKVRLVDEDNNIHFHGLVDDGEFSCELFLDWGTPYSGATSLEMHIDSYKELFGEPKYEKYLSKDGKWYSYMG